jgi:signal transduction histidine kinase
MRGLPAKPKPILKILALSACLAVCIWALYQPQAGERPRPVYLHFLYLLIVLGAFFFGLAGGVGTALLATGISVVFLMGMGRPLGDLQTSLDGAVLLGSFLLVGLIAGALSSRSRRLEAELTVANTGLEEQVRARTLALTEANEQLRLASRAKSEFLTNVSHEFKTPLNAILGFADLVIDGAYGPIDAEQRKAMEGVVENGEHLVSQVSNLLAMAKLESGGAPTTLGRISVNDLLAETVEAGRSLVRRKRVRILEEPDASLPVLEADGDRLRHVFCNLFANAVKFTDEGHVRVSTHDRPGTREVEVVFEDTGVGIPEADRERIFEKFVQVDSSATRRHRGTGIGLAIVDRAVRRLGGSVTVESEVGRGSVFRVRLPYTAPGARNGAMRHAREE